MGRNRLYQQGLLGIIEKLKDKEVKFHVNESCVGEVCLINNCNRDATHKVEEVIIEGDPNPLRHPLTNYICCNHYKKVFGALAKLQCENQKHDLYYKAIKKDYETFSDTREE